MLSHYAQLSSSMHARLFGSMQQHACLSGGARSLRSNFCLSLPVYMHRLSRLCAHGHNNRSEVCVSRECSRETAQTRLSCQCSHNRLVCFINACISNSFGDFVPEEDADFSSRSKYILHLLKRKKYGRLLKCI